MAKVKLSAKYASKCVICARSITPGAGIFYEKGRGSWHTACDGKSPEPLNSRRVEQMISADDDLAALAAQYGRQVLSDAGEPRLRGMMVAPDHKVGDILRVGSNRYLILAVGAPRYYSRDFLEDMDMFDLPQGRYADAQAIIVPPTAEEAQKEAEAAQRKSRSQEVYGLLLHSYNAGNNIGYSRPEGVTLTEIHGASHAGGSETWYSGSDGAVYYCRSDYDMGPVWWKTTATVELVTEAKALGVRP